MARQNIQFRGLRHTPSDITGQDGDLLECVNLIHENGEMKPLEMPERTAHRGFYSNDTLVAVHNLTDGKKFVYAVYNQVNTYIHIKNENGEDNDVLINGIVGRGIPHEEIKWAETIGNTLIIGTDKSIHYALYKNGQYKWLGDKLPQPVFEFDMGTNSDDECDNIVIEEPYTRCSTFDQNNDLRYVGEPGGMPLTFVYDNFTDPVSGNTKFRYYATLKTSDALSPDQYFPVSYLDDIPEENLKTMRDNLKAKMAKLISKQKDENKFIYPFFVRYAVRMFDGNYAMHSAPILMLPSTLECPIMALVDHFDDIAIGSTASNDWAGNIVLRCKSKPLKLKFKGFYSVDGNDVSNDIGDWSDIIKSIDLFLSSEVVTYNERYFDNLDNFPTLWYMGVFPDTTGQATVRESVEDDQLPQYGNAYAENNKEDWYTNHVNNGFNIGEGLVPTQLLYQYNIKHTFLPLESLKENEIEEKLENTNLFYRVKRYELDELKQQDWQSERYLHDEIEYGLLERLETLPTLPDDYVSRCRMVGSVNYNYNQRLLLGNISLQAPKWYQDAKLFPKIPIYSLRICFEIEKPEKTIRVRYDKQIDNELGIGVYDFGHYLFYPDTDCKRAYVSVIGAGVSTHFIVPMHEHTGLHGAYALMPDLKSLHEAAADNDFGNSVSISVPDESEDRYYQMPNTIAMSSVANPFHFPATNFKDIGRTKVIGIAANVLDVSSGQWGQYPLYVFCSDGIIAVMIDGEGKMGGIQAVSADVLREPHGLSQPTLIQTNQMLVFLTQRGVMAIAGTRINCISEAMNGRHFNALQELDGVDYHVGAFENLITRASEGTSFQLFADSGFLGYDYAHNRVLLLRPDREYQYVLSLNTMLWSKEIIYTNLNEFQLNVIPSNTASGETPNQRSLQFLDVTPIHAAVNNYTELYLQDTDGWLYKTMDVQGENSVKQLYQYGYLVSRPIRFGTDEYKTIVRALHRYTHYASMSFVKMALYGSRDGVKYGRINTLRGMSYQYFIFVVYTYLKPNERYSYMTVDFETRLTNKLR